MNACASLASEAIWDLVDGFPTPIRQQRLLMILRAFIDDSGTNQPPLCVLAGWIGPAHVWADFSDAWKEALDMKPRLNAFKMSEAMSFQGEFNGWSEESRTLRLRYLANLIKEHGLIAVGTTVPLEMYQRIFTGKTTDKAFDQPYFLMFHSLMAGIVQAFSNVRQDLERIDFIFDDQPGQMERMPVEWAKFKRVGPPSLTKYLGDPPIFRSDHATVALQAADMWAWYVRVWRSAELAGEHPPDAPWAPAGGVMDTVTWHFSEENLRGSFAALTEASRRGVPLEIWPHDV